jgi:hypothetical protein
MATTAGSMAGPSTRQKFRILLLSGDEIGCSLEGDDAAGREELDAAIVSLGSERFLRIGDTIVRSEEVRLIQLRPEGQDDDGGFLQDIKSKITGGDRMSTTDQGNTQTMYRGQEGQQERGWTDQPWIGYGRRPWAETKPFFLTSEFLVLVLGLAGVLVAAAIADNYDAPRAWLYATIIMAAYIVSRGIAKAGSRDPNPDQSRGMGYRN